MEDDFRRFEGQLIQLWRDTKELRASSTDIGDARMTNGLTTLRDRVRRLAAQTSELLSSVTAVSKVAKCTGRIVAESDRFKEFFIRTGQFAICSF
ncbi:MAG: hypothetical protein LBP35_01500 [Candidatus Ancillula trichonymphae]|nr:hypothetical protein [Candidatus Ancillula trichonymphae]